MSGPRGNIYVTSQELLTLKETYKYSGGDKSLIAARMQIFWNWAVTFIPTSVAPNMVTLIGLFFIFLSYSISIYYTPQVKGHAPWYIYVIHAVCMFCYQTLDALDGKHARRTDNSSPLGELFDHGCDAISTTMVVLTTAAALQLGPTTLLFFVVMASNIVFFFAQWEQYTVGTLVLGYVNVTEAQFTVMIIHLISAFVGPDFWLRSTQIANVTLQYNQIVIILQSIILFGTVIGNFFNVLRVVRQKKLNAVKTLSQLIAVLATTGLATTWVLYSPTNILQKQPHVFLMALGLLFSNLVGRIVFGRMCKADFSGFQPLVLPLLIAVVNAITKEAICPEKFLTWGLLALYIFAYSHFALSVIDVLCALLNIKCLIPKQKKK